METRGPSGTGARAAEAFVSWWRERRLRLGDLPPRHRRLSWLALGTAAASAVVAVAVGFGWNPPGGAQITAYGGSAPRFLIPWTCAVLAVLSFIIVASTAGSAWRFPWLVRASIALGGAALAAQTVSYGWIADETAAAGLAAARIAAWVGLAVAGSLLVIPQRLVDRRPLVISAIATVPFLVAVVVWATASGEASVELPDLVLSPRDIFAQATITVIGLLAASAGILVLWSIVLSSRQARDMGDGLSAAITPIPILFPLALAVKIVWLVLSYTGVLDWNAGAFSLSRSDGLVAWVLALVLVAGGGVWLTRSHTATPPSVDQTGIVVRWIGTGFAAVFIGAVVLGLMSAVFSVWPTTGPSEFLNDGIDWLVLGDALVPLWAIVVTSALAAAALVLIRRGGSTGHLWAGIVLTVWMAPRALELVFRVLEIEPPFDAPSLATIDALVTLLALVLAVLWWTGRQTAAPPQVLFLVLVVATLVAHPFKVLPAGWVDGRMFYLLMVYPLLYRFLFDSTSLNETEKEQRPGMILRTTGYVALLTAINAMLVASGRVAPGVEGFEGGLLGAVGEQYLLVPTAALAVALLIHDKTRDQSVRSSTSTRRWFWGEVAGTAAARKNRHR
ncbi:MAG: hypothetical protein KKE89_03435 [Actinobacteria bacterium]|nr:hypothetical protein [Actinomycetota bacterium]MBU1865444.1 hypothetical protein [Actinomycetota bacterium]